MRRRIVHHRKIPTANHLAELDLHRESWHLAGCVHGLRSILLGAGSGGRRGFVPPASCWAGWGACGDRLLDAGASRVDRSIAPCREVGVRFQQGRPREADAAMGATARETDAAMSSGLRPRDYLFASAAEDEQKHRGGMGPNLRSRVGHEHRFVGPAASLSSLG